MTFYKVRHHCYQAPPRVRFESYGEARGFLAERLKRTLDRPRPLCTRECRIAKVEVE